MSVRDDLIAARALIETPEKWVREAWEIRGCYCAAGALRKALGFTPSDGGKVDWDFWRNPAVQAVDALTPDGIADFNDDPTTIHADVMDLFNRAIASVSP